MDIHALIVDDEIQSIRVLEEKIHWARLGIIKTYGACSAGEARKVLDQHMIQLIMCDIEMPGESGLEFIQWLREQSNLNGKYTECIILTCYPEYSYMRKAMQIGCCDYLLKPVDIEEVEGVIEKAVRRIHESMIRQKALGNTGQDRTEGGPMEGSIIEQSVIPYVREHFTEMLTIDDIADHAALNPQYLMRLFKKRTGTSVLEYVTGLRLERAKQLLQTTPWTNEIISEQIGYASSNYFIKLFKNQFGITPREFRKNSKQNEK